MSPVRDPGERSIRRMQRDGAAAAKSDRAKPGSPAGATSDGAATEPAARTRVDRRALGDDELESLPLRERHGGRRDEAARKRTARRLIDPAAEGVTAGETATVVSLGRRGCEVELAGGDTAPAHLPKELGLATHDEVAVGDRVVVERRSGQLVIAQRLPRVSRLSRPDPLTPHRERVVAANLDLAVVVTSFRRPPLTPGLLDRFLVALAHGGVAAAIAVNKADLVPEPRGEDLEVQALAPYRALDTPLVFCSTRTGEGLTELRALLAGRTVAFVGHSGVGKSSLLNALSPAAGATVGEGNEKLGRGRHTTSRARIYRLAGGARVVDTPGIREFGLWRLAPGELSAYFEEFAPFAPSCRFANCTHSHEPRCAVRDAADEGELPAARYATYLRILASLAAD